MINATSSCRPASTETICLLKQRLCKMLLPCMSSAGKRSRQTAAATAVRCCSPRNSLCVAALVSSSVPAKISSPLPLLDAEPCCSASSSASCCCVSEPCCVPAVQHSHVTYLPTSTDRAQQQALAVPLLPYNELQVFWYK